MPDLTIHDALRLIATRAPSVTPQAARALLIQSPAALQLRYDHIAIDALADPEADWSADEREMIVALVSGAEDSTPRSERVFLRVTLHERAAIEAAAADAGLSISEYIRRRALG